MCVWTLCNGLPALVAVPTTTGIHLHLSLLYFSFKHKCSQVPRFHTNLPYEKANCYECKVGIFYNNHKLYYLYPLNDQYQCVYEKLFMANYHTIAVDVKESVADMHGLKHLDIKVYHAEQIV